MSLPYRANYHWHNHGKNLSSTVNRYYYEKRNTLTLTISLSALFWWPFCSAGQSGTMTHAIGLS
jgi:hypothetical protein